ncbi:MAG TPA: hypothetical protein VF142_09995 [Longimicrobium sp.]
MERFVREGGFWRFTSVDDLDGSLVLASLDVEIPMRRIYAKALRPDGETRPRPERRENVHKAPPRARQRNGAHP